MISMSPYRSDDKSVSIDLWPQKNTRVAANSIGSLSFWERVRVREQVNTAYSNSFHERPSRVIIATEATGPQVPDW
ncbi:Uncharacterised protein [Serratia fonticola]|nr:Uncharacterised protein [Serratia fonticola]CAI1627369.1 Uncharacterised protein [Serratia fonticola]CAI1808849.1 Uncharacterised protein [Serratia fonticola]